MGEIIKLTARDLVSIYKTQKSELEVEHYRIQTMFDYYVYSFCEERGFVYWKLTQDQLTECAYNFIEYNNK